MQIPGELSKIVDRVDNRTRFEQALLGFPNYAVLGFVVLISFLALVPAWMNYDIIANDGANLYVPVARLFLEGRFHEALYGTYQPLLPLPLYETLIFITAKITGFTFETSGRLVSATSFVIGAIGIYKITELLFKNRITALISVLFYLSHRKLLGYSVDCLKETLFVCIILWGNFFIIKGISSCWKPVYFVCAAVIFLAGTMVRSTSIIFLAAWLVVWFFHKKKGILTRSLILLPLVTFIIVLIYQMPDIPIFRRSLDIYSYIGQFKNSFTKPHDVMHASLNIIYRFIAVTYYLMGLFGLLGIYYCRRTAYAKQMIFTLIFFFFVCIGYGWYSYGRDSTRYIIAPIICLIPIASGAVATSLFSQRAFLKWLAIITILIAPFLWAGKAFTPPDPDRLARKEAGEWILSHVGPERNIVSNRERIVFYAKGKTFGVIGPPQNSISSYFTDQGPIIMPIAIDTLLDDGKSWKNMLDSRGIKPDKVFRSIHVYLPK